MFSSASLIARGRLLLIGSVVLGVAGVSAGFTSMALFTDQVTVPGNGFTTGTIDLTVAPTTAFFTVSNLMPGDSFNAPVAVTNTGTSQLRWTLAGTATGTGGLETQIVLAVGAVSPALCPAWNGVATPAPLSTGALGSAALSAQVLNAGATSDLCFRASLPLATGNAFQGTTASASFTFAAEQTANNP